MFKHFYTDSVLIFVWRITTFVQLSAGTVHVLDYLNIIHHRGWGEGAHNSEQGTTARQYGTHNYT